MTGALGVIAGTGFATLGLLDTPREERFDTAHGPAHLILGTWHGRPAAFCPRHGADHSVPPHRVNYRANVAALADLGVTEILAVNAVGGMGHDAGELVLVDDFIDYTRGRVSTFFDGSTPEGVVHADMTQPYDPRLRGVLLDAARARGVAVVPGGVYACFDGPRFETRAEIRMAAAAGATVVGMTGVPEVVLANERGLAVRQPVHRHQPGRGPRPGSDLRRGDPVGHRRRGTRGHRDPRRGGTTTRRRGLNPCTRTCS